MIEKTILVSLALALSLPGTSLAASANITPNSPSSGIESSRLSTTSYGLLQDFPSRKVVILRPSRSKGADLNSYLVNRLADTFRYPYYQVSYQEVNQAPGLEQLEAIAQSNQGTPSQGDLYLAPKVEEDTYYTIHSLSLGPFFANDDDDFYIRADIQASLAYYDNTNHKGDILRERYYGTEDSLTMPSHSQLYRHISNRLLKNLPYKRIPTDIPRYGQEGYQGIPKSISPEEFLQVEQPKSTKYRLTGVSVL